MRNFDFPHIAPDGRSLLRLSGPLVAVDIAVPLELQEALRANGLPAFSTRSGFALIDTGASGSAVDEGILRELQIPAIDSTPTHTPHGWAQTNLFNASASFPSLELTGVRLDRVLGCDIRNETDSGQDIIMLLGRDILSNFVVIYDGPKSLLTIRL